MDRPAARGSHRRPRRAAGPRALHPLRPGVSAGVPSRPQRRHRTARRGPHRGAARRRAADHRHLPAPGRERAHDPLPAAQRQAGVAVRRGADLRAHGGQGRRRAPIRGEPRGAEPGVDLRLRPVVRSAGPGARRHVVRRRDHRRVVGPARGRPAQRPGDGRRAHRPRDHDHPGHPALPAPGDGRVLGLLHDRDAAAPSHDRGGAGAAVRIAVRSRRRRSGPHRGAHRRDRVRDRRRPEPRRGPHPAQLPGGGAGDAAHQLLPRRRRHRSAVAARLPVVQAGPVQAGHAAPPAPALRDLRLLAARRGHPPARRQGRARRDPLVGPPRGLPHRGAGADEGPDGQERAHRSRRLQGRLRGQAPARAGRGRGAARGGHRLLPHIPVGAARPH